MWTLQSRDEGVSRFFTVHQASSGFFTGVYPEVSMALFASGCKYFAGLVISKFTEIGVAASATCPRPLNAALLRKAVESRFSAELRHSMSEIRHESR